MSITKTISIFILFTVSLSGCTVLWPEFDRFTYSQVARKFGCKAANIYAMGSIRSQIYEGECRNVIATSVTNTSDLD